MVLKLGKSLNIGDPVAKLAIATGHAMQIFNDFHYSNF
jgi:hypothetical protein